MSDYCFGTTDGQLDRRYPYSVGSCVIYDLHRSILQWNQQKESGEMSEMGFYVLVCNGQRHKHKHNLAELIDLTEECHGRIVILYV